MQRDNALLLDMLFEARDAVEFVKGLVWEEFELNRMAQRGVLHAIQTIGEAASHISEETKQMSPEIPWQQIVGMRHRIVHDYNRVNLSLVWNTVEIDLPPLIVAIERILAEPSG